MQSAVRNPQVEKVNELRGDGHAAAMSGSNMLNHPHTDRSDVHALSGSLWHSLCTRVQKLWTALSNQYVP